MDEAFASTGQALDLLLQDIEDKLKIDSWPVNGIVS
jgi:hypothetical protein